MGKNLRDRDVKSENELIHCVKTRFPSSYGYMRHNLWDGRVVKGEVLTSTTDLSGATKMIPANNLVVIKLVKTLLGQRGMSFLILYEGKDEQVLVNWSLVKK